MKRPLFLLGLAPGPLASAVPGERRLRPPGPRRFDDQTDPIAGGPGKSDRCLIGAKDTVSSCELFGLPD